MIEHDELTKTQQQEKHLLIGPNSTYTSHPKHYAQQTKQYDGDYYANYIFDGGTPPQHR